MVSIGSQLEALDAAMGKQATDGNYISANSETVSLASNITALDVALGAKQSGKYISSSNSVNANLKALDTGLKNIDNGVVHIAGSETITGAKTFSKLLNANGGIATPSLSLSDKTLTSVDTVSTDLANSEVIATKASVARDVAAQGEVITAKLGNVAARTAYVNTGNTAKEFGPNYTVGGAISTLANTVSSKVGSWSAGNYLTSAAAGDTTVSIGSELEALDAAMGKQAANGNYIKANSETVSLASNIASLDEALGAKQSGNYISSSSSVNENLKALDTNLASVDNNAVHKSGNETVAGVKTFVDNVVFDTTDGIKFGSSGTVIKGISDDAGTNSSNMIASTKAVYEAVHGEGSDVVHKSGEETLTGAKTFEAVTTFSGTKGIKFGTNGTVITGISDAVDSDSSNTIASAKAVKTLNDSVVHITGNETIEGVKTFTGLVTANGGMDVRGVSRFYDNVVIGTNTSGGARSRSEEQHV